MYAAMLLMRGTLSLMGSYYLSISTTIAIRYSCVRRQTVDDKGLTFIKLLFIMEIVIECDF